ncbi:PREDICTED: single-stranded DNA-binding protein WHY1, chloroplastic-like [Lupinus angustifolius]|uniref:single-stranded DNA-binding protein WHY1, chloroplastic-like n=1 Tax=Lupinus angustifolius TaxID=3871 RepID=UPI00092F2B06|nr:PREDICTED: single-stranded DNA-binding protein WHY1, chloroplastic-like [Lupinus angustifolius]XP_019446861.1 PREDICTED: single-stranded DNA-binding protein WHY1, chloroplastic-like [Lupinus angustifolius]
MLLKLSLPMPSPLLSFSQNFIPFSHPFKPLLTFNNSVKCRHSQPTSQAATPTPHSVEALPPRVYVNHSIYKGKAALTLTPRPPEFAPLESGAFKVSKEGHVLLQFAPAVGLRQYDWERKQIFSLSVGEMGTIISLGARDSCEFFHDPSKGKSDEGKVRKVLKVEPLPDGSGHSFKLSVQNKLVNVDENIYIPVTKAEIAVLSSIFNFIIPYLIGWNTFTNSIKPDESIGVNSNSNPRYGGDYEWNR